MLDILACVSACACVCALASPSQLAGVELQPTTVPGAWEGNGLPKGTDGVAWYVGDVHLAADDVGSTVAQLELGEFDDAEETWVNGVRVGATNGYTAHRAYEIPAGTLRAGVNRIAIRVRDDGGAGGWVRGTPTLTTQAGLWDLSGQWWIAAGDHPELAEFDAVMDPNVLARLVPLRVGKRGTLIVPSANARPEPMELWYEQPAKAWTEALPVGNGRLGGMVYGGALSETVQLNESSVWEGNAEDRDAPKAAASWKEVRALALAGKLAEAQDLAQRTMMLPQDMKPRSYMTLGELTLQFDARPAVLGGYRRSLHLESGIARTEFSIGGANIRREVFVSAVDELLIVRTASMNGEVIPPMRVRMHREPFESDAATHAAIPGAKSGRLLLSGQTPQGGVRYVAAGEIRARHNARAETTTGPERAAPEPTVSADGDGLLISGATEIVVAIAARTNYWGGNPDSAVDADLRALNTPVQAIQARHEDWMRERMQRAVLSLHSAAAAQEPAAPADAPTAASPESLPTDKRLRAFRKTPAGDMELLALYFQYGRYLLLSSSRAGGLPANLQGIWNPHFRAPWNADFHTNINLQMNYWLAGPTALAETELPLFDLLDRLQERGAETARDLYGAPGWTVHHTTDPWAFTAPEGRTVWGMFPLAGAWLTRHAWEHYLFTGNRTFLATRAFPAMRGSAEFVLAYLVPDPATGELIGGPAASPENSFVSPDGGRHLDMSMGTAIDQWIARDLFTNLLDAARVLGAPDDPLLVKVREVLPSLAVPRIGDDGRLMEWRQPFAEAEPGHRHMSHLYGLHPGTYITPGGTPEYAAAARKSLEFRLSRGGGHTGWSRAWLINFWARLHDGARAYQDCVALLQHSTLPNLLDDHPPFQIDGNFGGTAGIAEMLLQSHVSTWSGGKLIHRIDLLPALPAAWPDGTARGFVARGGVTVDIAWRNGALTSALLQAQHAGELRVLLPPNIARIKVAVERRTDTIVDLPDRVLVIPPEPGGGPRKIVIEPADASAATPAAATPTR